MSIQRRTLLWAAPVVSVAAAAPSFATSTEPQVPDLSPVVCRRPGEGKHDKDYFLRTRHRDAVVVLSVVIGDQLAEPSDHGWTVSRTDSRVKVPVVIQYVVLGGPTTVEEDIQEWSNELSFDVCEERK